MGRTETSGTTAASATAAAMGSSAVNVVIPADSFRPLSFMGLALIISMALSVGLGATAIAVSMQAEREARLSEYYAVDLELCLLKQICKNPHGVEVPADPWGRTNQGKTQ